MPSKSKFDVYHGKYIPEIGSPIVLITGAEMMMGTLYSEYFIFLEHKGDLKYYSLRFKSYNLEFSNIFKIDINYMMQVALQSADGQIVDYVFNKYKDDYSKSGFDFNINLEKATPALLIQLYIENKFRKEIKQLIDVSKAKELMEFIDILLKTIKNFSFETENIEVKLSKI